jgi:hypothetical protein
MEVLKELAKDVDMKCAGCRIRYEPRGKKKSKRRGKAKDEELDWRSPSHAVALRWGTKKQKNEDSRFFRINFEQPPRWFASEVDSDAFLAAIAQAVEQAKKWWREYGCRM